MFFTDQMGNHIELATTPRRIVSLVPSQTEFLFALGLEEHVAGITKFCIHPKEKFKTTPKVGGTKQFRFDVIEQLQPDLIIGNKEENYREGIEQLQEKYPVWMSDIFTLTDACQMMLMLGELTGKAEKAGEIVRQIRQSFEKPNILPLRRALYLIWKEPYMCAGTDTFIYEMMQKAGFVNCVEQTRYPMLTEAQIRDLSPEVILLSSEPYPFKEKHAEEFKKLCPGAQVKVVDGEMFSWYGSRLLHSAAYFETLLQEMTKL